MTGRGSGLTRSPFGRMLACMSTITTPARRTAPARPVNAELIAIFKA